MMQFIRDHAQGWIAWVIVVLICVPFALWGVQEYMGVDPNVTVAEINGEEIGLQRFQQAYQRNRANLQVAIDDPVIEQRLKLDTVERLVQDEVIVQTALSNGLRISDEQLAIAIQGQAAFQADGRFSQAAYEGYVRNQGFSPGGFEFNYRRTLLAEQIFSGLADTAIASTRESEMLARLAAQQRSFSVLKLDREKFKPETLDEAEIASWYEEHKTDFRSPEQVKLAYIMLSKKALAAEVDASDDVLRSLYEGRKEGFRRPEERRARHILVAVGRDADEAAQKTAEAKINDLHEQLSNGADFEALAKANSDDPGSGAKGGDLGFFAKGWMAPEFEAVAFALKPGELSAPVRTSFGFHIIRLEEVRGGDVAPFEAVREQLLRDYQSEQSEGEYYARAERLQNLAYEQPDNLDVAAEELGLEIKQSGFVTRSGIAEDPVFGNPNVLRAAFSDDVLRGGNNSELLEVDNGDGAVVLRLIEHKPSTERELAAVREQVVEAIKQERVAKITREAGEALVAKLRDGASALDAAAEVGAQWQDYTAVTRRDSGPDSSALTLAFKMPRPTSAPTIDGVSTGGGDFLIVRLTQAVDAEPTAEEGAQSRNVQTALLERADGATAFQNTLDSLREGSKVVVHEDRF